MNKIVVLGNGGHSKSIIDVLERERKYKIVGCIVNDSLEQEKTGSGYPVIGTDADLEAVFQSGVKHAAIGIGFLGKSDLRKRIWKRLKEIGFSLPIICDPTAILANHVEIGEGSFVGKGAIINTDVTIGKMCIINTGAIIEHDCIVSDFSHISAGSILCGGVEVGELSFVGAGAAVIQGKKLGKQCIVGAGVAVRKDLEDFQTIKYKRDIAEF